MTTLSEKYIQESIRRKSASLNERLRVQRSLVAADEIMVETSRRVTRLMTEVADPTEMKKIADAVSRLQGIAGKFGGENGQLPALTKMINDIVKQLKTLQGAGAVARATTRESQTALAKAAALEGILKSGFSVMDSMIRAGGQELNPEEPLNTQDSGKTVINAMTKAFDPGRVSSLTSWGTGAVKQFFGVGSIGSTIAKDLANLSPRQLGGFAKEMTTVQADPKAIADAKPDATAATNDQPANPVANPAPTNGPTSNAQAGTTSQSTPAATQPPAGAKVGTQAADQEMPQEQHLDPEKIKEKAGIQLGAVGTMLRNKQPRAALLNAALALKNLGVTSIDQVIKDLSPKRTAA